MDELKSKCEALALRLAMLENLPENPWLAPVTGEMAEAAAAGMEKGFREALIIGRPPDWAAPLRGTLLIDWHEILADDDGGRLDRLLKEGDFKSLYLDRNGPEGQPPRNADIPGDKLLEDPLFLRRLGALARLLTEFMAAGGYLLRLRPEWFLFHEDRLWAAWDQMEKHSAAANGGMIRSYEPGWMHPALRKREIPPGMPLTGAVSHAYACLILYTLTRMPPPRTLGDFTIQVDRFRVYNPDLSPLLRPFFRKWLLNESEDGTPLECWRDLEDRVADILDRRAAPFLEGRVTCGGDSALGRNKRNNDNEDTLLILNGLPPARGLAGVADGVSTATIGSGWAASAAIKRMFQVRRDEWTAAVSALAPSGLSLSEWEGEAFGTLNEFFDAAHQAVAREINQFAEARGKKGGPSGKKANAGTATMSSTLAMALVAGNRALTAHWGDSRAYLVTETGLTRLTEDHNRQLHALVMGKAAGQPYRASPEDDGHLIRTVGACRWSAGLSVFEPVSLEQQPVALNSMSMRDGEAILICSDGLLSGISAPTEGGKEAIIWEVYRKHRDKGEREIALALTRAADDDRGDDNISVVVMTCRLSNEQKETSDG